MLCVVCSLALCSGVVVVFFKYCVCLLIVVVGFEYSRLLIDCYCCVLLFVSCCFGCLWCV